MGDVDHGGGDGGRGGKGCTCAKESADDAVLCVCATEVVVKDGEEGGRVDRERCRAGSFRGGSGTSSRVRRSTYGLRSAGVCDPCCMKIADELGPNGIVASTDQKRQRSCNPPLFFNYALRRNKGPFRLLALPSTAHPQPTGTHPQGRRVQSCTLPALHTNPR